MGLGSGVSLVGYRVQWVATVMKQPAHRSLTCRPTTGAKMGSGMGTGCALGTKSGEWGSPTGRSVSHLFPHLVQVVPMPLEAADAVGDSLPGGGQWVWWVCQAEWVI